MYIAQGEESCIYSLQENPKLVISVFKNQLSEEFILRYDTIAAIVLKKDPTREHFVCGDKILSGTMGEFMSRFPYIDFRRCDEFVGPLVFFTIMPALTKMERPQLFKDQLIQDLEILHSNINDTKKLVHGDIKADNIMIHKGKPVLIDFGRALIWPDESGADAGAAYQRSPKADVRKLYDNVINNAPNAQDERSAAIQERRAAAAASRSRSRSPGSPGLPGPPGVARSLFD